MPWFERTGGKKFTLTGVALIMGFILAVFGKLTTEFTAIIVALSGFYNYANTAITKSALENATPAPSLTDVAKEG